MIDDHTMERARKVLALIRGGATDGERQAATERLKAIAARCEMTIGEIVRVLDGRPPIGIPMDPKWELRRRKLRPDYDEFLHEYAASRSEFNLGEWVPARLMAMTGWILWELLKVGYVEKDGDCFRPME